MIEESIRTVQEAESKADDVMAEAQARAKEIRREAEAEAAQIMADAKEEARELRQAAEATWKSDEAEAVAQAESETVLDPAMTDDAHERRMARAVEGIKRIVLA